MYALCIRSLKYSININAVEVDLHSDLLHNDVVKSKNSGKLKRMMSDLEKT